MKQEDEKLVNLPIDNLQANPLQPRGVITNDSLKELVDSIKEHGLLEPLVVAQTPAGYQIIAGERRWRASKLAGMSSVPAIVKKTTPRGMLEMAIVENVQRKDLNPLDRAKAFKRLIQEFRLSMNEVAVRISKSPSYVSNTVRLLELPDALTDGLLSGEITEGHARALSSIDDPHELIKAYKIILSENGSVRRAEELAREYRNLVRKEAPDPKRLGNPKLILNEELKKIQDDLRKVMGERAKVDLKTTQKRTRLNIVFKGTPESTKKQVDLVYQALKNVDMDSVDQG